MSLTPWKALRVLCWWSNEGDQWKLGTALDTLSSVTLDFSEKFSICCLKPTSSHCCLVATFEESETETLRVLLLMLLWAGESWQEVLISHFSASSHLEGKLFLGRPELKVKTGLPGVEGASNSLLCCETEWPLLSALPLGTGKDLTNSEVSFRLSLQSGSGKSSAKGLSLLFPYMFTLLSVSASCITKTSEKSLQRKNISKRSSIFTPCGGTATANADGDWKNLWLGRSMAWHSEIELAGVGDVREMGMQCL